MIARQTNRVTAFDRALAGWEVGPLSGMLGMVHLPVSAIMLTGSLAVTFFGDRTAAMALLVGFAIWLAFAAADVSRSMWIRMHSLASQRWLNAVREAVGNELFYDAIDRLRTCFGHDPAYAIHRADLTLEIRVVRAIAREDRQRAGGISLAVWRAGRTI